MNTFGRIYTLTSFGESHGPAMGGVIDGMPAGLHIDLDDINTQLRRRRPGSSDLVTSRPEPDTVEFLSGIKDTITLGTPIGFIVRNTAQRSADYTEMQTLYRPGHADYTYQAKYGIRDPRGGGRASARETVSRVVAGALARQALATMGIAISARLHSAGTEINTATQPDALSDNVRTAILNAKARGDSLGGIVTCTVTGVPAGWGDPAAAKLQSLLAAAMLSIPAAKGFDYGMGFAGAAMHGTQVTDNWLPDPDDPRGMRTAANHSGGIQGGITNGEDITMRIAFKPTATLLRDIDTVNTAGHAAVLHARGRHDPCVAIRAVPVVEAMAACVLLDAYLVNRTAKMRP